MNDQAPLLFEDHIALGLQHIYDMAAIHAAKQYKRAEDPNPTVPLYPRSKYKAIDGCQCLAGIFIHESEYDESMEGCHIIKVMNSLGLKIKGDILLLLKEIQIVYDTIHPDCWYFYLTKIAEEFNLKTDVLTSSFTALNRSLRMTY